MRLQWSGTPLALNEHLAVPPRMHIQNFQKKLKGSSTIHHLFGPVSWLSDTTERCSHSSCFNQIEMCRSTRRLALRTGKIGAWRKHRRSRISGILNVSALENRYLHPPIHRDFSLYPYYEQSIHHIKQGNEVWPISPHNQVDSKVHVFVLDWGHVFWSLGSFPEVSRYTKRLWQALQSSVNPTRA